MPMAVMGSAKGERLEHGGKQAPAQAKGRRSAGQEGKGEELAHEAWEVLFEVIRHEMRHIPLLAAEFDLSPVQVHVLRALGESSLPMSSLADFLGCDASNVTGLVDRLEARGLVVRQSAQHDRRVKLLVLTEAGAELRTRLLARLMAPPPSIAALSAEDLRALRDIMRRALENLRSAEAGEAQSSKKV